MKRLPILVVESRPLYVQGKSQPSGCRACAVYIDKRCKEQDYFPRATDLPCLSTAAKPWGSHYEWSQHKISVSRNKREGKFQPELREFSFQGLLTRTGRARHG